MNLLIAIASLSIMFNVLCIRELRRKQESGRRIKGYASKALGLRKSQVRNLIYEIKDLEKKVM